MVTVDGFLVLKDYVARLCYSVPLVTPDTLELDFEVPQAFINAPGTPAVRRGDSSPPGFTFGTTDGIGDLRYTSYFDVDRSLQHHITDLIKGTYTVTVPLRVSFPSPAAFFGPSCPPQCEDALNCGKDRDVMGQDLVGPLQAGPLGAAAPSPAPTRGGRPAGAPTSPGWTPSG